MLFFICNGNVDRSQEAELFFNAQAGPKHWATSASVNPKVGKPIDPMIVKVMNEIGFDMTNCWRKAIDLTAIEQAGIVISFKPPRELPPVIAKLRTLKYWNVDDPQHKSLDVHRQVRDEVEQRVSALVAELNP